MPVNSANTQLQCPEFTGFFLCAPPAVAPLYELKVNTRVFFHKISNNNVSVRSETQCLWDLTMLGGRNLFRKKKKKKKSTNHPAAVTLLSLSLSFFSEPAQPRFYSPQQFIPLTAKRSKKCRWRPDSLFWRWMQMRGGFFFGVSGCVPLIWDASLHRNHSLLLCPAVMSCGEREGWGWGGESPEHPDPQG